MVAEKNQGGAMVENTIRVVDPNVALTLIHASRGKITRAEPVSALYEQNRVSHLGMFAELEDQMCSFAAGSPDSPDRMDAMVYALTELMVPTWQATELNFHPPTLGPSRSTVLAASGGLGPAGETVHQKAAAYGSPQAATNFHKPF